MAPKRYCTHKNKLIHETVDEACVAAQEMREAYPEYRFTFYTCWRCAKYHVGRKMTKARRKQFSLEAKARRKKEHKAKLKAHRVAKQESIKVKEREKRIRQILAFDSNMVYSVVRGMLEND